MSAHKDESFWRAIARTSPSASGVMSEHEDESFRLSTTDGEPGPVLGGVHATGRLDGVLFELTLRQTYRNTRQHTLEVVYSFPLPSQAVLLGFAADLNGQRKDGVVTARRTAEREYERALAEGDAPVMLEKLPGGLHTANVGNLKPGDEIVLEIRYAQLLRFEQGRLRLAIPTTIAPRHGDAQRAGLQPQQVPVASASAEYPLSLSLTVGRSLARAAVDCPTHAFARSSVDGELRLDLRPGATLDRDVVVVVTPDEATPSLLVTATDTVSPLASQVVLAAFQTRVAPTLGPIAVKLLIDCSGSMAGDSIESARRALHGVIAQLGESDQVSLSRFGSRVEVVQQPAYATPRLRRRLAKGVGDIDADLGGTEMLGALQAAFALRHASRATSADVLLITDGEVWAAEPMIDAARASGHRVFAIGVGAAPAEGVLRELAEATGGACEFATPGESLEAAAQRMLARMRQQAWQGLRVEWGAAPQWQTALPASAFGSDTVIVCAGFSSLLGPAPVRLLAAGDEPVEIARGEASAPVSQDAAVRLAASRRLARMDAQAAQAFAVRYQLLTGQTHCVLVHRRADADKASETAELHQVQSMLAAGWGATSTVGPDAMRSSCLSLPPTPKAYRCDYHAFADCIEPDASQAREPVADLADFASLQELADAVAEHLSHGGQLAGLPAHCRALALHGSIAEAIARAADSGIDEARFWLLLAHWVNDREDGAHAAWTDELLAPFLQTCDSAVVKSALEILDDVVGHVSLSAWPETRSRRLRSALARGRVR
jgi:Ca-activated chloride channel family protein